MLPGCHSSCHITQSSRTKNEQEYDEKEERIHANDLSVHAGVRISIAVETSGRRSGRKTTDVNLRSKTYQWKYPLRNRMSAVNKKYLRLSRRLVSRVAAATSAA